jgi:ribosomal protein S18 acetylase RimI-like enzyme
MDKIDDVRIRHADSSDLRGLEWEGEYRRYRRLYQKAMQEVVHNRRVILVAESNGKLVGQIFVQLTIHRQDFKRNTESGYLHAFRVRPQYRNRGIGTRLLQSAEAALYELGFERAVIAASVDNHGARRLYERQGYRPFTEDPGNWSYVDHQGQLRKVHEPAKVYEKWLVT